MQNFRRSHLPAPVHRVSREPQKTVNCSSLVRVVAGDHPGVVDSGNVGLRSALHPYRLDPAGRHAEKSFERELRLLIPAGDKSLVVEAPGEIDPVCGKRECGDRPVRGGRLNGSHFRRQHPVGPHNPSRRTRRRSTTIDVFGHSGTNGIALPFCTRSPCPDISMNGIIYLVGLIVVVMAILSFLGLH
jgi:hypothetical protein